MLLVIYIFLCIIYGMHSSGTVALEQQMDYRILIQLHITHMKFVLLINIVTYINTPSLFEALLSLVFVDISIFWIMIFSLLVC